jgi:Fe-S cluster assembly protein SufD
MRARAEEVFSPAALLDMANAAAAQEEGSAQRAFRAAAAARLADLELPDRVSHLWRYTDPTRFLPDAALAGAPDRAVRPRLPNGPGGSVAVIGGGALRLLELDDETRRAGVRISDLHGADLADRLGNAVGFDHGFAETVNAALWQGGVLITVPAGVDLRVPLGICVVAGVCERLVAPRVLVALGPGASCEVVESHVEGGEGTRVLGVTELLVADDARLRYALVQRWRGGVIGHLTVRAHLGRGAGVQLAQASFGGTVFKADVGAVLAGVGAEAETTGVTMAATTQQMDHHTEHLHIAGKSRSRLDFKVALSGAARSTYTGMIRIGRQAGGSEAYQENRNLLLSPDARAESIPELEILTDDVKCSHGATVAPVEEEQIFYLASRGLSRSQATRLVVYGFLDQTLRRLPDAIRERIEALVAERLHT